MSSTEELKDAVLDKLRTDPLSITPEDARRLSEQVEVTDRRSAKIVSAVNSLAVASQDIKEMDHKLKLDGALSSKPSHVQAALVTDLEAAVDKYPHEVSPDVFKKVQAIATKMQRAIAETNAPYPGLKAEFQEAVAKIEPKIEQETVTKAEADHLHSLEAKALGHTAKGGITARAQSVVAKRERTHSLGGSYISKDTLRCLKTDEGDGDLGGLDCANKVLGNNIVPIVEEGTATKKEANGCQSGEADTSKYAEQDVHAAQTRPVITKQSETPSNNESGPAHDHKTELAIRTRSTGYGDSKSSIDDSVVPGMIDQENLNRKEGAMHGRTHQRSGSKEVEAH